MATRKLYYENPDLATCQATVLMVDAVRRAIVTDVTIFFPEGGGQVPDTGVISEVPVVDVQKEGGVPLVRPDVPLINVQTTVVHFMEQVPFEVGQTVEMVVDIQRRRKIARMHSATHVVLDYLQQKVGNVPLKGCRIDDQSARLDLAIADGDGVRSVLEEVEHQANDFIKQGYPIETWADPDEPDLRFWRSGHIVTVCGGIHARSCRELRPVKLGFKSQGKTTKRVYIQFV